MRYRTVLFDADNTLLDFTRSEHDALCDCLTARGLPHDEEAIARYSAINDGYWKRLERGEVTRAALQVGRFADFMPNTVSPAMRQHWQRNICWHCQPSLSW